MADYSCVFGISTNLPALPAGHDQRVFDKDVSFIVVGGHEGRLYWFFFAKFEKRCYAPNIPKFTKADAESHVQRYLQAKITEDVTFGDLWERRTIFSYVPLEEYLLENWTFDRFVCLGDAVHKVR